MIRTQSIFPWPFFLLMYWCCLKKIDLGRSGAFHLSELTDQSILIVMRISLLTKTNHPHQSNPKYYAQSRWFSSKTSWKTPVSFAKMRGPAMVRPASSDFWNAPLVVYIAGPCFFFTSREKGEISRTPAPRRGERKREDSSSLRVFPSRVSLACSRLKVQTLTTKDCKGPQTNMPKNVGSIKTWSAKIIM